MIVSPNELRKEMVQLLKSVDAQIKEIEQEAERFGIPPEKMRDSNGNWVMIPLLLAKVQAYSTLVQLNAPKDRR